MGGGKFLSDSYISYYMKYKNLKEEEKKHGKNGAQKPKRKEKLRCIY